jgi:hypothetical protein
MARKGNKWKQQDLKNERPAAKNVDFVRYGALSRCQRYGIPSPNQTHKLVKSSCSLLIDPCAGAYLRPLPGAHFEFIGKIKEFEPEAEGGNPRISLAEAARRIGRERAKDALRVDREGMSPRRVWPKKDHRPVLG